MSTPPFLPFQEVVWGVTVPRFLTRHGMHDVVSVYGLTQHIEENWITVKFTYCQHPVFFGEHRHAVAPLEALKVFQEEY